MAEAGSPAPAPPRALPATQVLVGRLGWLIRLRWVAVAGTLIFVEFGRRALPIHLFPGAMYGVLAGLAAYNLVVWLVLGRVRRTLLPDAAGAPALPARGAEAVAGLARFLLPRTPPGVEYYDRGAAWAAVFASAQIVVDLLFLAALLHFSGGIENPLRVFFVFHVIISSILLSRQATFLVATLGVLLLSGVALGEMWGLLPHYSLEGHWRAGAYLDPGLVGAQLFLLAVTQYVAAYLAGSIAARLRRRELDVVVLSRHLAREAATLEEAYAELRVAERAKSQYMRKVAHELREPLGTVKTALTVALSSASDSLEPQTRDLLQRAERRAGDLADMTRELLALARAQGGRAIADMVLVDMGATLRTVLDDAEARAREKGVTLTRDVAASLPQVLGDPEALADAASNLVANALRYTPAGGTVTCAVGPAELGGRPAVLLEVADTGIGIPAADLPRIFEEFFRSPMARAVAPQGSGLGMAIVKAAVDRHGGTVAIASEEGLGTRVTVRIPVAP